MTFAVSVRLVSADGVSVLGSRRYQSVTVTTEMIEAQFGVRDFALSRLRSYLSVRQQRVNLGQHFIL